VFPAGASWPTGRARSAIACAGARPWVIVSASRQNLVAHTPRRTGPAAPLAHLRQGLPPAIGAALQAQAQAGER